MKHDSNDTNKTFFSIFNFQLLEACSPKPLPEDAISPAIFSQFVEEAFHKKINLEGNLEILIKPLGRKPKAKTTKRYDDPDITISEIIDNYDAGIPMTSEVKMKAERLTKMKEKRAQKNALKARNLLSTLPEEAETLPLVTIPEAPRVQKMAFGEGLGISAPRLVLKDGKLVIDESYLVPTMTKELALAEEKPHKVTSMSFRQRTHTKKWTEEETDKFMTALKIFGSDFSMISQLFPTRTREQIKNKFRKEDKENPAKIDAALKKKSIGFDKKNNVLVRTASSDGTVLKIMDELTEIIRAEI